jgi:glyoxylase-like metal-dependent hydrolase (beta-lactamase superfamily II)
VDIHLLDVGQVKYGDCILITHGGQTVLVDAGHPGDTERIRSQLRRLLRRNGKIEVDLLVVTHCHSDHIGCMPALVGNGDLSARVAVVADEKFGFGRAADDSSPVDALGLTDGQRALVVALQEEDHSDLPQDDLEQFLQDVASLEDKYIDMLEALAAAGTKIVRFGRDPRRQA